MYLRMYNGLCCRRGYHFHRHFFWLLYSQQRKDYGHDETTFQRFHRRTLQCIVKFLSLRSADKVGRPFCCCIVFLRFPTLVGNLSVFVLSFLLYYSFFPFFLYHLVRSAITLTILNRFTSNFHSTMIVTRRFDSYTFQ